MVRVIVIVILCLVASAFLADDASAYYQMRTAEMPEGFHSGVVCGFLFGGYFGRISTYNSLDADFDPTARVAVWDSIGNLLATSPEVGEKGITSAVALGVDQIVCTPEEGQGAPYLWNYAMGTTTLLGGTSAQTNVVASGGAGVCGGSDHNSAFLRTVDGEMRFLDPVANGNNSCVCAINSQMISVGTSSAPDGQHGVVWNADGTIATDLGVQIVPLSINDSGQVVGIDDQDGVWSAFEWQNEVFCFDHTGQYPIYWSINDAGKIVGTANRAPDDTAQGFVRDSDGTTEWLGEGTFALAINNDGAMIGSLTQEASRPVFWVEVPESKNYLALAGLVCFFGLCRRRKR